MNNKINKSRRLHDLVIKQRELKNKQIKDVGYYYLNKELTGGYHYE
jgi:hypothetical protein